MYAVVGTSERLRRRVYQVTGLQEVFNDSNVQVLLKSSPEKCRLSLSPIAEKAGPVVKLNDSGSWRRRFALVVPHTFLYYFVQGPNDQRYSAELRPHGVIDLELYTDVTVLDGETEKKGRHDGGERERQGDERHKGNVGLGVEAFQQLAMPICLCIWW